VRLNLATQHRAVVLRDPAGGRYLPIWIGPSEADAINAALTGQQFPRPMTHDLSLALLRPLNATVRRVTISRIADNTFFSEVEVAAGDQVHSVDARPSDALALAARAGAPIYASSELLALHEQQVQAGSEGMPGPWQPLEQGAPPPQPLRLLLVGLGEPTRHELLDELFIQLGQIEAVDAPSDDRELQELATQMSWAIAIVNLDEPAQLDRLRAMSDAGVRLPILALGPDDKALADEATALGARAYLAKPVGSESLRRSVREAMLEAWRSDR
jgi:bifunctional DNase/RNase/CheY-like chemotaxis protein